MLDEGGILRELAPLLAAYAAGRQTGEGFGDFVVRTDVVAATRRSGWIFTPDGGSCQLLVFGCSPDKW